MTDEIVECFNCGRPNPEWAQVCRSCGVPLRHGQARTAPTGRIPTDRDSLISMVAVVATILGAVVLGLFVSSLNTTDPGLAVSTASPTPTAEPTIVASATAAPTETPTPEPTPTPLPGTLAFGTGVDEDGRVTGKATTFTPGMTFAYSVEVPGGFGATQIENEVRRVGGEGAVVLPREKVGIGEDDGVFGYPIGQAEDLIRAWGPGEYQWRVFVNDELVARKRFRLAEG